MGKSNGKAKGKIAKPAGPVRSFPKEAHDLGNIPKLIEGFIEGAEPAHSALMAMGRHAAHTVLAEAEARDHDGLRALGRKLSAVPPQANTNLYQLRTVSVLELTETHRATAKPLVEGPIEASGEFALFDPLLLAEDLARGGKPRRDAERLGRGDLAIVALPVGTFPVVVKTEPAPTDVQTLRLRLKVRSGLVFVGPPAATEGPRMGAVRLDPFSTRLHEYATSERFFTFEPGLWAVEAAMTDQTVTLWITEEPTPRPQLTIDPYGLAVPGAVDASDPEG